MDRESPELIEREMEQTRASLTEKVSALEQQVVGTIHGASHAVTSTVESVKTAVQETLHSVKDTVQDSVHSVTDTMKTTFDLPEHTRNHPWAMVGGATALGFVTGLLLFGRRESSIMAQGSWEGTGAVQTEPSGDGRSFLSHPTAHRESAPMRRPGWVDELVDRIGREALKLGELALATATTSLRQTVETELPKLIGDGLPRLIGTEQTGRPTTGYASSSPTGPGPERSTMGQGI